MDGKLCRYVRYSWGANNLRPPTHHVLSGTWGMPQEIPCDALFMEYLDDGTCWDGFIIELLQYGELVQIHKDTNKIIGMLNLSKHHAKAVVCFLVP